MARNNTPLTTRLTRVDWDLINEALALLEAHGDDNVADGMWSESRIARLEDCRYKVSERVRRAARS